MSCLYHAKSQNKNPMNKLPWKTRVSLSVVSKVTDKVLRSNGTINRKLLCLLDLKSPTWHFRGVKSSDHTIDSSRNLWFRLFIPTSTTLTNSLPVIVFFHGGGFAFLSAYSFAYDFVCRVFARKFPAVIISVNYRLSPEHRYPSQYDDGFDVLAFLDQNHSSVLPPIADISKCFLAGDSAGANIAHHVAVRTASLCFQNLKLIGLISIMPFFGGEERTESEIRLPKVPIVSLSRTDWLWKAFLPEGWSRDHEVVNVSGLNAVDLSGLDYPETVVVIGGLDPLQDWQRRYCHWLKRSGKKVELIEYPNMFHAFYVFPELPEAAQLITQLKHFVANRTSSPTA